MTCIQINPPISFAWQLLATLSVMSGHDVDMQWLEKNFHNGLNVLDCDFKVFPDIVAMAQCRMRTFVPCLLCVLKREWMLILADVILAQRSYSESPGAKAFAKETKHQSFICNEIQNQTEKLFEIFRKRVNETVKEKPTSPIFGDDQSCRRCLNVSMMDATGEVLLRHFKPELLRLFKESDQADCLEEASQYYRDLLLSESKVMKDKNESKKQVQRDEKQRKKKKLNVILSTNSPSGAGADSAKQTSLSASGAENDESSELMKRKKLRLDRAMLYRWDTRLIGESAKYHKKRGPRFAVSYATSTENLDLNAETDNIVERLFHKNVNMKLNVKTMDGKHNVNEDFDLMASLRKTKSLAKSQVNSGCPCCHLTEMMSYGTQGFMTAYARMIQGCRSFSSSYYTRKYLVSVYRFLSKLQPATCTISQELLKEYHEDGPWTMMDLCYTCTTENGFKIFKDLVIYSPIDFVQDLSKRIQQSCLKKALKSSSNLDNR